MLLRPAERRPLAARRSAFTLLEVLIVVAIIVVLAGVGTVYMFRALDDAKVNAAKAQASELAKACQGFQITMGRYPESLNELTSPPGGGKPYVEPDKLLDPWGAQYQYDPSGPNNHGLKPDVFTNGPNGEVIGNWAAGH